MLVIALVDVRNTDDTIPSSVPRPRIATISGVHPHKLSCTLAKWGGMSLTTSNAIVAACLVLTIHSDSCNDANIVYSYHITHRYCYTRGACISQVDCMSLYMGLS